MRRIGFSTGALAKGDFRTALEMLRSQRDNAIELSALRIEELPVLLDAFDSLDLGKYGYIAIHAPTNAGDDLQLVQSLKPLLDKHPNVVVVVHPDTIHAFEPWSMLAGRVCIENMDSRKPVGQTVSDLRDIFNRLPDARLCLDVGHARQVDSTMIEALLMLQEFGARLSHVHISEVDSSGGHHGMSRAAVADFQRLAGRIDETVPVIVESCVAEGEIESELQKARESFQEQI